MFCWRSLGLLCWESISFCQSITTYWSGIRCFHHEKFVTEQIVLKSNGEKEEGELASIRGVIELFVMRLNCAYRRGKRPTKPHTEYVLRPSVRLCFRNVLTAIWYLKLMESRIKGSAQSQCCLPCCFAAAIEFRGHVELEGSAVSSKEATVKIREHLRERIGVSFPTFLFLKGLSMFGSAVTLCPLVVMKEADLKKLCQTLWGWEYCGGSNSENSYQTSTCTCPCTEAISGLVDKTEKRKVIF